MIFQIEQNQKTMLTADFSIFREKNIIGSVSVKGEINSMYKSAVINLGKDQYHMSYAGDLFSSVEKSSEKKKKYWQPYKVDGNFPGKFHHVEEKEKLFHALNYDEYLTQAYIYTGYTVGIREKGITSIYVHDKIVAQIDKNLLVKNELHNFTIYADGSCSAQIAVLFSIYLYMTGFFEVGQAVSKSITKGCSVTWDKSLKDKYDPKFKSSVLP